ncbi:MAG: hypothetical protein HOZ81_05740 [Streptomyces sp.]|nr:hypothetical protein [Streptomyces sp.]NUT27244.1 hypothetical protein [Streptomyces sp.]
MEATEVWCVIAYNAADNPAMIPHRPEFLVATAGTPVVPLGSAELAAAAWSVPE